jgi:SAM-dependent methyltransferase
MPRALTRLDLDFLAHRAEILTPELVAVFDERFIGSAYEYDEFVYRLALGVFRESGLEEHVRESGTTEEIAARAGFALERVRAPLDWILRKLAAHGALEMTAGGAGPGPASASGLPARFRLVGPLPVLDPAEPEAAQQSIDPSWSVSYEIARVAAQGYPAFLRGEIGGEEILFSPDRLRLWFEYFSNKNGLYIVNNICGALCAEERLTAGKGLRILEIGGGLGSGALALLDRLEKNGRLADIARYDFTELVPAFLRRGQRNLADRFGDAPFLAPGRLDMNKPFAGQGIEEGSVSLVYAVNTIHVAHDLSFTLGEVRRALAPGGAVVISECIRPFPGQAIYAEMVFNLMESFRTPLLDPRFRPNGGFLTPEQWTAALLANGFTDVRFVPDVLTISKKYPSFYAAAAGATRT